MAIPNKNFTYEQATQIWSSQKWRCAGCNRRCGSPDRMHQIHHKKRKSALTRKDLEEHGTAGGVNNGVGLCNECHDKTHTHHEDFEQFNTPRNGEIE